MYYPKKVAFIGDYIWIACLANLLVRKGVEVHVIPLVEPELLDGLASDVHLHGGFIRNDAKSSPRKLLTYPSVVAALRRKLAEIEPDLIHAFYVHGNGWFAALSGFHPFVLTSMGGDISKARGAYDNPIKRCLTTYAVKKADVFTVVSDDGYKQVRQYVPEIERVFFRAGFNPEVFYHSAKPADLKQKYGLNGDFVVMSPRGFASRNYNIETIVRGFHEFNQKEPNSKLLLVGTDDTEYKQEIEQLVAQLGLSERVSFSGLVDQERMRDHYNVADVVVSVTLDDGFPATITESYACGKPIIVAVNNSITEIFSDGDNGFMIEPTDEAALAEKLMLLKNERATYETIARYNLENSKRFDMNTYLDRLLQIYAQLLIKI